MRTKLSKILLTVALALCSIGLFTACSHEHVYTKQITEPTRLEQGYTTYTCFCGHSYVDDYVNALDHVFTNYLSDNNATYERDGTKTAHCDRTGCTATDSVTDVGSKLQSGISFNTLTVENESVFGKVSNATETFSFIDEITTFGKMKFIVSLDIYGTQQVVSKNISLSIGDNTV